MKLDWHIGGTINAITPVSNTLYVGTGSDLLILDITNPVTPTRLGALTLGNPLGEIVVAGDGTQGARLCPPDQSQQERRLQDPEGWLVRCRAKTSCGWALPQPRSFPE